MTFWVAGAAVVSAGIGYAGSKRAADAMGQAAEDPFGSHNRRFYQDRLRDLNESPGAIFKDPTFTSALNLGLSGVEKRMAAQGFLGSGNESAALMQYGMGFGLDWMKNQQQFFGTMAGGMQSSSPGAAIAGATMEQNGLMSALGQVGGAMGMLGGGGGPSGSSSSMMNPAISNPASYQVGGGEMTSWDIMNYSDRRLKTNIQRIGSTPGGQPWYSFTYVWGEAAEGVMADESPIEAVSADTSGYLMVDYSKIL